VIITWPARAEALGQRVRGLDRGLVGGPAEDPDRADLMVGVGVAGGRERECHGTVLEQRLRRAANRDVATPGAVLGSEHDQVAVDLAGKPAEALARGGADHDVAVGVAVLEPVGAAR
jgi:hypothetical protein